MYRKKSFKQTLRVKLWISYILVFLIPLFLFATVGYVWLSNNITDSVKRHYSTILTDIVNSTDEGIKQLEAVSNQLSRTAWISKLINMQGSTIDPKRVTQYDLFEYNQNIYSCMKSIDLVNAFGFYLPNKNLAISSAGNGTLDFILKDALHIVDFNKDDFNRVAMGLEIDKNAILIFDDIFVYGKHEGGVLYLRSIQPLNSYVERGVIYAYIPKSVLVNNMKAVINSKEFLKVTIMDKGNSFIDISSNEKDEAIEISTKSEITGWEYRLLISKKAVLQDIAIMRNILLSTVMGLLLVCIAMSAVFSQRIYQPVRDLLMHFNRNGAGADDEFFYINNSIIKLLEEQGDLRFRIEELKPSWISCSIIKMLIGDGDLDGDAQNKLQEVVMLTKRKFFNICILIRRLPNGLQVSAQPIPKVRLILDKIPGDIKIYIAELIDQTILLVNYESTQDFSSWLVQLLDLCPEVVAVVGEQVTDLSMIRKSYEKANLASKYRKVQTGYRVLRWEENDSMYEGYYLPINMEMQVLIYLQTGSTEQVCSLINEIYQKNMQDSNSHKVYWDDLMESIYKLLETVADKAKIMLEPTTVPLSLQYLMKQAEYICMSINHGSNCRTLILENIVEYVNASIENKDLSLQYVAQKFNISTSFVSKAFKEKTGINFNSHINNKRLELAKELLLQGHEVLTIAHLVGYTNDVTLRRQFKIFTGMTPTAFRNQYSGSVVKT